MLEQYDTFKPVLWDDEAVCLLDQRLLPQQHQYLYCRSVAEVAQAIRDMVVRGAPAIGITAAYGVALAARQRYAESATNWRDNIEADLQQLEGARPTAINLHWAIARMRDRLAGLDGDPFEVLLQEARAIHEEDIAANLKMGKFGASLIVPGSSVLTHCNAGALATGGHGTALGVIRSARADGKLATVYADETRPWLQGARLTAWELLQDQIPVTLVAEGAAAWLMQQGKVQWVIVGSDRIVANGDVANKIGTYSLAVLARQHGVKFMVAAPTSTIDMAVAEGGAIPIEQRDPAELLACGGQRVAAEGATAWNPVFDVTPAQLVDAIVTERGIIERPDSAKLARHMGQHR
ncbi:S-methyl-5-thioribose-1-phosphate isomerase [Thiohalophilus thiocyanatoxydans]|uniref:Methylthioribose-1-phosphate isomerase n=1 Tax=Thiohalophilus thiocyanatoxydans TaxID=381308 RepID=A0A4R8IP17_9GAMM|nr:S-methyl-5-thioribose-1-phosphate isomerase [Thiohalophilus thiocyanatoxydans]TDY02646.1 methylthioribose-1-phosphate isomerase [Thiohalophilus thiocyanatoxydans]